VPGQVAQDYQGMAVRLYKDAPPSRLRCSGSWIRGRAWPDPEERERRVQQELSALRA
jgi:hypothetical protein